MRAERKHLLFRAVTAGVVLAAAAVLASAYNAYVDRFAAAEWPRQWRFTAYYWLHPGVRGFLSDLASTYDDGTFSTVWDESIGVHLARDLFESEAMDGQVKYAYRPYARKLTVAFNVWGGQKEDYEVPDTPAVRADLARIGPFALTAARYDGHGFRMTGAPPLASGRRPLVVLGDSFADGFGVDDGATFAARLDARARAAGLAGAVDTGVNGYGPLEEYYALLKAEKAYGRPGVIVLENYPNDVWWDYDAVWRGRFPDSAKRWAEHDALFRRIARRCRQERVPFVVAAVPPMHQAEDPAAPTSHYQRPLAALCRREGAVFVDLLPALRAAGVARSYLGWDTHFSPFGHQVAADAIWAAMRRAGLPHRRRA